jgi:hypothetical protein
MKNWMRALLCVALLLGLTAPAFATLNDSNQPGSVLVFHKFLAGTNVNPNAPGGIEPKTEIEISVACPKGATCPQGQTVRMRGHWVCAGLPCAESDFDLFTTVKGTVYFNPDNIQPATSQVATPPPFCDRGYLIVWVIDSLGRPIKYDGLLGNAVLRDSDFGVGGQSAGAYNAVPIQAAASLPTFAPTDVNWDNKLDFNGTEYKMITGRVFGTVRYESAGATPFSPAPVETTLTLLTLDVISNDLNFPTIVPLNFYNQFEVLRSTSTLFFCWAELRLTDLNSGLDETFGRKGLVESGQAYKTQYIGGDTAGPVTLLGIISTRERDATQTIYREYSYSLFNDGKTVKTRFVP